MEKGSYLSFVRQSYIKIMKKKRIYIFFHIFVKNKVNSYVNKGKVHIKNRLTKNPTKT